MQFHSFDREYLDRLAAGDPATERHFSEYFGELMLIKLRARQYTRNAIEDIRQETFLRVLQALRRNGIREPERIGAFVNSVCNNVILEHGRANARHAVMEDGTPEMADEHDDAESELVSAERRAQVRQVLSRMPEKNRRLLSAVFLEERPTDEICREFGVDQNYLRVLLFRARAQFRQIVEKAEGREKRLTTKD